MSLEEIKVTREEVLDIVKENKSKHDVILKDAIEGYWKEAERFLKNHEKEQIASFDKNHKQTLKSLRKRLREDKKNLRVQVKQELGWVKERLKDADYVYMRNPYPENHADDYIGTIRRLELCVENNVKLNTQEFDRFIRNKWEWRDSFLTSNTGYVNSLYDGKASGGLYGAGRYGYAISASYSSYSLTSSYATGSTYPITASWALNSF